MSRPAIPEAKVADAQPSRRAVDVLHLLLIVTVCTKRVDRLNPGVANTAFEKQRLRSLLPNPRFLRHDEREPRIRRDVLLLHLDEACVLHRFHELGATIDMYPRRLT